MSDYVTDTHPLIWYLEESPRLSRKAREAFEACELGNAIIYVPTICMVEIIYLQEKGRIPANLKDRLYTELKIGSAGIYRMGLNTGVVDALVEISRDKVADMPDRIIAATSTYMGLPLISNDSSLKKAGLDIIW